MSLQAPLSKYSPPTHYFLPINMVYSAYSLYKYTSRTKYTLIAWEQTPLLGKKMHIMGQKITLARLEVKAGLRTMSGQKKVLSGQILRWPDILPALLCF